MRFVGGHYAVATRNPVMAHCRRGRWAHRVRDPLLGNRPTVACGDEQGAPAGPAGKKGPTIACTLRGAPGRGNARLGRYLIMSFITC
jgi:hypothetical protein